MKSHAFSPPQWYQELQSAIVGWIVPLSLAVGHER
jgi:hypothetical protein